MTHRKINHTTVVSRCKRESVTNKLMDKRTVLNRGSTWALRDLRRIYRIPACVGSCLPYFITRLHITHITAYRATTEREREREIWMSWSRHPISIGCWSKWIMITTLNCCSRWDRCIIVVLASHVTQLHNFKNKEREKISIWDTMKQIVAVQNILSQVKKEHTVSGSDVSVGE